MEIKTYGSSKDLAGDFVYEILPSMVVVTLFGWVASKALARCLVSEMVIAKAFFGIVFLAFGVGALAMSYIVLIALVDFIKDAIRKEP